MKIFFKENLAFFLIIVCGVVLSIVVFLTKETKVFATEDVVGLNLYKRPVTEDDIILGNPNADLFIVEYGDLQCPFCRIFHKEMKSFITSEYGTSGKVAWVWRNGFHIDDVSEKKARVVNCVKLTTNDKFNEKVWKFLDESIVFTRELKYPKERYSTIFRNLNIDEERVEKCIKNQDDIHIHNQDLFDIGKLNINKTPHVQIISRDGDLLYEERGYIRDFDLRFITSYLLDEERLLK